MYQLKFYFFIIISLIIHFYKAIFFIKKVFYETDAKFRVMSICRISMTVYLTAPGILFLLFSFIVIFWFCNRWTVSSPVFEYNNFVICFSSCCLTYRKVDCGEGCNFCFVKLIVPYWMNPYLFFIFYDSSSIIFYPKFLSDDTI